MASSADISTSDLSLINSLSPSIKKVYGVLLDYEQMTINEIRVRTQYSRRTVSFALRKLIQAGLVKRIPKLLDMRRYHYIISSESRSNFK